MKHFLTFMFILVALTCAFSKGAAQSHNVTLGNILPQDVLLDREIVVKKYKFLRIQEVDFTYPREDFHNDYIITGIRCTDRYTDGDGGFVTLERGGPGFAYVTLQLKSKRSHGFGFLIEVFGKEEN